MDKLDFFNAIKEMIEHITLEGFQYDGDLKGSDGVYYVPNWAVEAFESGVMYYESTTESPAELFIKTISGTHHINVGDWIIKGADDKLRFCESDLFDKAYEIM